MRSQYAALALSDHREHAFWNERGRVFMAGINDIDAATVSFGDVAAAGEDSLSALISVVVEGIGQDASSAPVGGGQPGIYGVNTQSILEERN